MQVPTPIRFEPHAATLFEDLSDIPASYGIYALTTPGNPPHISWSINLRRRLHRLLLPSYTAAGENTASSEKPSSVFDRIASVSYWRVSSRLERALILYELTRQWYPDNYLRRLHLRMPWFIGLTAGGAFARLAVSNRLSARNLTRFGPFRTREAALLYQGQVLSLHQIRRCVETLTPSGDHPGCIYGEMNQCLRPCQGAVSEEEYSSEGARVSQFLSSGGKSALQPLLAARDRAAAELDFEQAALAHKRSEKVQAAMAARDTVIRAAKEFHGIAVTRSVEADSVNLWPMYAGYWQSPISLYLPANREQVLRSLDAMLRERLHSALSLPSVDGNRLEQLALFSRWYYSSWRDGPWFSFETLPQLNYRRLVKAISDLVKPPVTSQQA